MCLSGLNLDEICGLDEREIFLAVAAWSEEVIFGFVGSRDVRGGDVLRLGLIGFFLHVFFGVL